MGRRVGGWHDEIGEVAADDLLTLVTEDHGGLRVPADHASAAVHGDDRVHRGIDDRAGTGFALPQFVGGALDSRDLSADRRGDDVAQEYQRRATGQADEQEGAPMSDQHRLGFGTQFILEAVVNRVHLSAGGLVLLAAAGGTFAQLLSMLAEFHSPVALEVKAAGAWADRLMLDVDVVPLA